MDDVAPCTQEDLPPATSPPAVGENGGIAPLCSVNMSIGLREALLEVRAVAEAAAASLDTTTLPAPLAAIAEAADAEPGRYGAPP